MKFCLILVSVFYLKQYLSIFLVLVNENLMTFPHTIQLLLLLLSGPTFRNMSIFTKLIILKSTVCSDWPAIQCVVFGPKRRDVGEAELKPRPSIVTAVLPCKDKMPASSLELYGILPLFYCPLKSTITVCTFIHLSALH